MTRDVVSVVAVLSIVAGAPMRAQDSPGASPAPAFQIPSNLYLLSGAGSRVAPPSLYADSSKGTPDYRYEGAIAGAVVFGAGFTFLGIVAHGECESDCGSGKVVGVGLLGVLVGGLTGLLIGGMFPKDTPHP